MDRLAINVQVLIGCDGVHSAVGRWLGLGEVVESGRAAVRGLALHPQGHGLEQEVHQFLTSDIRAGVSPLGGKESYWFLLGPSPEGTSLIEDILLFLVSSSSFFSSN